MFAGGGSHVMDNDRGEILSRPLIWGGADGPTTRGKIELNHRFEHVQSSSI